MSARVAGDAALGRALPSWLPGLVLVLAAVVAYAGSLSGSWLWDDDDHVTKTQVLGQPDGLRRIWLDLGATQQYYPLVHTTFWLEHELWGLEARGFRTTNLVLHGLNALLLLAVLRRLALAGGAGGRGFDLAWLAAAVFALHPLQVETVAWVSERKNLLSGLFVLTATLAYLRFDPLGEPAPVEARRRWHWLLLAAFLFVLALLSKTVAATWPAALLVLVWWKRGRIASRDVLPLAPLFALAVVLGLVTVFMERENVGAVGPEFDLSPAQRLLIAGRALCFYAAKLLVPVRQSFIYARWEVDPSQAWQWLFPLAASGAMAGAWLARARLGRGPLAALLLFAGTLFPALGFFNVYPFRFSFVADHFQYLAGVPLLVLVLAGLRAALARRPELGAWSAPTLGMLLLAGLALLTERRTRSFTSALALWQDVVAQDPRSKIGNEHLGNALAERGDVPAALAQFARAIELNPDYAENYCDRGVVLSSQRRYFEALNDYNQAIALDPNLAVAYYNRANLLTALGRVGEAAADFAKLRVLARGGGTSEPVDPR